MKRTLLFYTIITIYSTSLSFGQTLPRWKYGISASFGTDLYNRKIYTPGPIPGAVYDFKSDYSWGLGLWAERSITGALSVISRLNFSSQKLPNHTLCDCGSTSQWYQYDRHYWSSVGLGVRGYLNPAGKIKLFAEGGISADWFLGYTEAMNHKKEMNWNADGYHRFAPGANMGIGLQYKRVGLVAEYNSNIARTFTRPGNGKSGPGEIPKVNILRSGFSIKAVLQLSQLISKKTF